MHGKAFAILPYVPKTYAYKVTTAKLRPDYYHAYNVTMVKLQSDYYDGTLN